MPTPNPRLGYWAMVLAMSLVFVSSLRGAVREGWFARPQWILALGALALVGFGVFRLWQTRDRPRVPVRASIVALYGAAGAFVGLAIWLLAQLRRPGVPFLPVGSWAIVITAAAAAAMGAVREEQRGFRTLAGARADDSPPES